jgi:hypothetical protein
MNFIIRRLVKKITPPCLLYYYRKWSFDESNVIYKGVSYNEFMETALEASRPGITGEKRRALLKDMKKVYLKDGTRPDEYLLYNYDSKSQQDRSTYLPQRLKDVTLIDYYGYDGSKLIRQLRDKYQFFLLAKPFFKRDVVRIAEKNDWSQFEQFCKEHSRFICKIINGGCGVGVRIEEVKDSDRAKDLFEELIGKGKWIIEELIKQDPLLSSFNDSSVNTVRFPSFRHGNEVKQNYPCIRFGRRGYIVDNAAQKGVFASVDIRTGKIISNGFDELGHEYEVHPDSKVRFKEFQIPKWTELLEEARLAHLSLPEKHTYVAIDFALSEKGWVIVEANWGDWVLQQTSLKQGLKKEFLELLKG